MNSRNILTYKFYYFLGIGGIGMSALARFFNHYKKKVAGYDKTSTDLTERLIEEHINCFFIEDVARLKNELLNYNKQDVLVIYTPAIPTTHSEYQYLVNNDFTILKRSQVLGEISKSFNTIAIAGTHGKTTTTTMISHLLKNAGINCFSFMGGISSNYNTNLLLGNVGNESAWMVVEADEYDRSFLTLEPKIAIITSADADHLDIYGNDKNVKEGYKLFSEKLKSDGILIVKKNVDNEILLTAHRLIYSLNLDTEYCAKNITINNAQFSYNIVSPQGEISGITLGIPGFHNVENSIAAVAAAQIVGLNFEQIREGLRSFKGVKRRFEFHVNTHDTVYIDDYAHHPEELNAFINSVRKLYPNKKITGIFQPHLYTRTRDFSEDFAKNLSMLDECILLEIYPARELPIENITSAWLLNKIVANEKKLFSKSDLINYLKQHKKQVLLTMGAGDIDQLVEPIKKAITTNA
ncbi:MAG: UDP-N-acetylmuramate--L-alanine ligase [Bacteroidetes bacterium]|nr:UDP-N-acetylmuramate--L-alanine ligase [Bacteroidota bacterium]